MIGASIQTQQPEINNICTHPSDLAVRMRERRLREELQSPPSGEYAHLVEPVTFQFREYRLTDPRTITRIRDLGRALTRLAEGSQLPVTIVVTGYTDPVGSNSFNHELGYQRAIEVIRWLHDGTGLPADCCIAESYGKDPRFQIVPNAGGNAPGAGLNRRVEFSLDFPEVSHP